MIPLITFVCHFYSWTWQECIKVPIKVFFEFYRHGMKMESAQYRERLDIAVVSTQSTLKYYNWKRAQYDRLISQDAPKLPPKPPQMYINTDSEEGKDFLLSVFKSMKRGMGYGG